MNTFFEAGCRQRHSGCTFGAFSFPFVHKNLEETVQPQLCHSLSTICSWWGFLWLTGLNEACVEKLGWIWFVGIFPLCFSYFVSPSLTSFSFFLLYSISTNKSSSSILYPPPPSPNLDSLHIQLYCSFSGKAETPAGSGMCTARRSCRLVNKFTLRVSQVRAQALSCASVCVTFSKQEEKEIDCPLYVKEWENSVPDYTHAQRHTDSTFKQSFS